MRITRNYPAMGETIMSPETVITDRGEAPVYHAGTLAYLDSFGGMIPCTVVEVLLPGTGYIVAPKSGKIRARINVTRGGYHRGEIGLFGAADVVPRNHHHYRGGSGRINSLYAWA